jgi:hypothetical protein
VLELERELDQNVHCYLGAGLVDIDDFSLLMKHMSKKGH